MASFFDNKARAAAVGSSRKHEPVIVAQALQPWVEKYRPKNLDEVKGQPHVTNVLRRMLNASNFPHLLLYGPPGTGKTSTILALSKDLYGPELMRSRVLELNASDERGIEIVRGKIRDFARQQMSNVPITEGYKKKYPCPPMKILILDEADSLSQDAQSAMRRVVEVNSKTCRFVFCCNYVSRIIDPLASRCSKFRFLSLSGEESGQRLKDIADMEGLNYENGVIEKLLKTSDGDLRRAITMLQSCARLSGAMKGTNANRTASKKGRKVVKDDEDEEMTDASEATKRGGEIPVSMVDEIAGTVPDDTMQALLSSMQPERNGQSYNAIAQQVNNLVADGWSAAQVLSQLYSILIFDDTIDSRKKQKMLVIFSEIDKRLIDGAEEHLQMLHMVLSLANILSRG